MLDTPLPPGWGSVPLGALLTLEQIKTARTLGQAALIKQEVLLPNWREIQVKAKAQELELEINYFSYALEYVLNPK